MNLAAYLLALAAPLVIRALVGLGFSAVSFVAVTALSTQLINIAVTNWASIPTDVLMIATISGVPQALGMIGGAYTARVAVWAAANGTKYVLK